MYPSRHYVSVEVGEGDKSLICVPQTNLDPKSEKDHSISKREVKLGIRIILQMNSTE